MSERDGYRWIEQACPICSVPPSRLVGRRGGKSHRGGVGLECDIWSCGKCGLMYPNPMPIPVDGLGQHYDVDSEDYFLHDPANKTATASWILEDAERLLGGKGKLLDIGAGRGEMLKLAVERGWDAEGVEPSESFAAEAAASSGASVHAKPLEECGLLEGGYDVVILSSVLEHLYNPNEVIAEISRILKPGGLLFFDVPNEKGLLFKVGNLYEKLRGRDWCVNLSPTFSPYHVFGYSVRPLRTLLENNGLRVATLKFIPGESLLPSRPGMAGKVEVAGAKIITSLSKLGRMGSYIMGWAEKAK